MTLQPALYRTWETSTAGKLAQSEFAFQRMHREPAPPLREPGPLTFNTAHKDSFRSTLGATNQMPPSAASTARYTVGTKNALGTHAKFKQVTRDELRVGQVHFGDDRQAGGWETTFSSAFANPDQSHPTQGRGAPRGGIAPRMPFSEVERQFGSLDSTGTMPGENGVREGTSEQRAMYKDPGVQPLREANLTLGYGNDIGTATKYHKTKAMLADETHYSLGNEPRRYETTTMTATAPPLPAAGRPRQHPAGMQPGIGPSEVEQGFKQSLNSRHFNIITGGPRLFGEQNTDATLYERNTQAFDKPVGRKQHPCVNPRDRGVTGLRQSYDIISGIDRPKERW